VDVCLKGFRVDRQPKFDVIWFINERNLQSPEVWLGASPKTDVLTPKSAVLDKNSLFSIFYLKFTPFEKLVASAQKSDGEGKQT
jgi:hypothetical protein